VLLAALDQRPRAEYVADRLRERLRAVDDGEHGAVGAQAAVAHLGEQCGAARGVLRGALADAEHVLVALRVEAERDEQHVGSSPTYTPSIISTTRSIALRSRPSHSAICFSVAATKRRLTALRLVPRVTSSSGTGSSDRA
jgi:hypothetical protein